MTAEEFLKEYKTALFKEAEYLLSQSMPALTEELFSLFETTGNRLSYESVYFARRKFLTVFGLQAIAEKDDTGVVSPSVLEKLETVIKEICAETCWALPAHVNRGSPDWQVTVDLFSCETGQTLSELADRLRLELSESTYRLIVENVEQRVLRPFLAFTEGYGWEKANHNWNAVCCGSIGSICLHLLRDREDILRPCLDRVCASLPYYLDGFAGDGTCLEGLDYYFYGMSYFVNFAQELAAYTDGDVDLMANIEAIASFWSKCYFPDGRTVNFSDGSDRTPFRAGLALALNKRFPQAGLPDFRLAAGLEDDNCWRFVFRKMDLFETGDFLARNAETDALAPTLPFVHILPEAQWCIAASQNGVGFACKGGTNGEPHNHNDIAHFIYEAAGDILLADLGAGEYTSRYFSLERYEILCNGSQGHSVPLVNGRPQLAGSEYHCQNFDATDEGDFCRVNIDLAGAYKCNELHTLRRIFSFSHTDGKLTVEDTAIGNATVTENLITYYRPILTPDCILLRGKNACARISIDGVNPSQDVTVMELPHRDHAGKPVTVYSLRWEASRGMCRFVISLGK